MPSKTLQEMEAEVGAYCREKGWYDDEVSVPVALALLHEEVSEAGRAWRDWGFDDATAGTSEEHPEGHWKSKPQGWGSELADVVIRVLDYSGRYGLDIPALMEHRRGAWGLREEALVNINTLHDMVSRVSAAWDADTSLGEPWAGKLAAGLANVLAFTFQLARRTGVGISFEYERKMQYNRTRDYRHGGRRA